MVVTRAFAIVLHWKVCYRLDPDSSVVFVVDFSWAFGSCDALVVAIIGWSGSQFVAVKCRIFAILPLFLAQRKSFLRDSVLEGFYYLLHELRLFAGMSFARRR